MENIINIKDFHKKANIYKELCLRADQAAKAENYTEIFNGWMKCNSFHEAKTNFKGVLYSKGKNYLICYCGTDSKSIKDHIENLVMGIFGKNLQMRIANYYYVKCKEKFGFYNDNLTLLGHSEGGTEATYVGIKNKIKVVTFNSYGLSRRLYCRKTNYSDLVINYRDSSDIVSKLKENPGQTYIVPSSVNQCLIKQILGSVEAHKLSNFGDCENAVLLEEYMESHPFFIRSYKIPSRL